MTSPSEFDVYPLYDFDNVKSRRVFVTRVLRFDDVLDAKLLSGSLEKLLNIGDWRKLAGHLHRRADKRLELRVPRIFPQDRWALVSTRCDLSSMSINEHPKAKLLHRPSHGPSIQPAPDYDSMFAASPEFPRTVEEFIKRQLPQISLHITSFNDATLIGLVWSHTLTDAFGVLGLLHAWSLVLAGKDAEVPPVLGSKEDILEAAEIDEKAAQNPPMITSMRLRGFPLLTWALRQAKHYLRQPKLQAKTVFVPAHSLAYLVRRSRQEASESAHSDQAFVSEGDIITAWVTKALATAEASSHGVTVNGFFNLRARLPGCGPIEHGIHMQNLLMLTYAPITAQELRRSIGSIALAHRRHLQDQTTKEQVLAVTRQLRKEIRSSGDGWYLFGAADSLPLMVNNFLKADFMTAVDFGPAVIPRPHSSAAPGRKPGMMTTYYYRVLDTPMDHLSTFFMLGKDADSNCWLQGNLRPKVWRKLEEELQALHDATRQT